MNLVPSPGRPTTVIHHLSLGPNDVARATAFHDPMLAGRGLAADEDGPGYGAGTMVFGPQVPSDGGPATVGNGAPDRFADESRSMVDGFHRTALRHGANDAGEPGLRPAATPTTTASSCVAQTATGSGR